MTFLPLSIALASGATPAPSPLATPVPEAGEAASARLSLELAVSEIEVCCQGQLERGDLDAQRRWAYPLYRWLVHNRGRPNWNLLAAEARFSAQALRLDPAYVAALAVLPRRRLEERAASLPAPAAAEAATSLDELGDAVYVFGLLEQELERAAERRSGRIRDAERAHDEERRQVAEDRALARTALAEARRSGQAFDLAEAFAARQAEIKQEIERRQGKIRSLQDEFWSYQRQWTTRNREVQFGTAEFYRTFTDFQTAARRYGKRIDDLTDEIEDLERRRGRYRRGAYQEDLDRLERPPATRPVFPPP